MKKKLTLRVAAAAMTAGVALSFSAPAAFAANPTPQDGAVTASNIEGDGSFGPGYNNVINGHAAASRFVIVEEGDTVQVYCVQEGIDFNGAPDVVFSGLTYAASGVTDPAKAAGIAVNSASIGTPLTDARSEGAAVQLAVWKYSSNLDYSAVGNAAIKARADVLVANAPSATEGITSFKLNASSALDGENNVVTATLLGNGAPLADSDIKFTVDGSEDVQTVKTNAEGVATFSVPATETAGKATLTYNGILAKGSILAPVDGQIVVTVDDANIARTAAVDLAPLAVVEPPVVEPPVVEPPVVEPPVVEPPVVEPPVEEPPVVEEPVTPAPEAPAPAPEAPAPAPDAAPVADGKPKQLPHTGTWVTPGLIALAAALAGGGFGLNRWVKARA